MANLSPDVGPGCRDRGARRAGEHDIRARDGAAPHAQAAQAPPPRRALHLVRTLAAAILLAMAWSPAAGTTDGADVSAALDAPSPDPGAVPTPMAVPEPSPPAASVVTRVVIPSMDVDLPVISGDQRVPRQGPDRYPPCDVALYHTTFGQPGDAAATYLYAHARPGMFLSLLEASLDDDGVAMLGAPVEVYTSENKRYLYEIRTVKRHAVDYSLALDVPEGEGRLVLQTSEGPAGSVPKLQVLAVLVTVEDSTRREARLRARPRPCYGS